MDRGPVVCCCDGFCMRSLLRTVAVFHAEDTSIYLNTLSGRSGMFQDITAVVPLQSVNRIRTSITICRACTGSTCPWVPRHNGVGKRGYFMYPWTAYVCIPGQSRRFDPLHTHHQPQNKSGLLSWRLWLVSAPYILRSSGADAR